MDHELDMNALAREASDPDVDVNRLMVLARDYPQLHPLIASNPAAYEGLIGWLRGLNDPLTLAVLDQRDRGVIGAAAYEAGLAAVGGSAAADPVAGDSAQAQPAAFFETAAQTDDTQVTPGWGASPFDTEATTVLPSGGGDAAAAEFHGRPDYLSDPGQDARATSVMPAVSDPVGEGAQVTRTSVFGRGVELSSQPDPSADAAAGAQATPTSFGYPQGGTFPVGYGQPQAGAPQGAPQQATYGYPQAGSQDFAQPGMYPFGGPQGAAPGGGGGGQDEDGSAKKRTSPLVIALACLAVVAVICLVVFSMMLRGVGPFASSGEKIGDETTVTATATATATRSSTPTPSQTTSSAPTPTRITQSPQATRFPAPDNAVTSKTFHMPSNNINCAIDGNSMRCTLLADTFSSCGDGLTVTLTDKSATQQCGASDAVTDGGVGPLIYGTSTTSGDFACTSTEDGLDCWNTISGRGFHMARESLSETQR